MIFSDIMTTFLVFGIFVMGSLSLNLVLLLLMPLPIGSIRKRAFLHKAMAFCCKLPVYAMVHIRKRIINLSGEDFSRPALIISNHQSHIDLLLLLMLHPKIIVVTTKWVWNNPIYALVIRYLEYYPVMEGYEVLSEKLMPSVQNGYSVLVFLKAAVLRMQASGDSTKGPSCWPNSSDLIYFLYSCMVPVIV